MRTNGTERMGCARWADPARDYSAHVADYRAVTMVRRLLAKRGAR